jgi:hypothetical protein
MSEAEERLAAALGRLRGAALGALARRLGLTLAPTEARMLDARYGLARSAELVRLLARLPLLLRSIGLRWLLRGSRARPPAGE